MVAGKDIVRVCLPLTAGVLVSSLVFSFSVAAYAACGLCAIALALALLFCNRSISFYRIFWIGTFFVCGVFCYCNGLVTDIGRDDDALISTFCRDKLSDALSNVDLKNETSIALAKALILGDRSSLGRDTIAAFRNAGGAHLLALSGMHLGIIYLVLSKLLILLGNGFRSRTLRSLLIIIATGAYTIITGAAPSLCRAWLFIALRETSLILERPQPTGHIFCAALTIHLIFNPLAITQIGFQLSYLAMVGIVFVWPKVRQWYDIPALLLSEHLTPSSPDSLGHKPFGSFSLGRNNLDTFSVGRNNFGSASLGRKLWDAASLAICCQLFTAPLTLLYFGTFPKYFLITNLIAAPLTTLAMLSSLILLLFGLTGLHPTHLLPLFDLPLSLLTSLMTTISTL